ncbi:MAG: gliding motility-associated C-terminal domain-containing protein [Bacteroidia bacterium]|nr:gliding motility-associated C-terminal domain-containing protein [Bacteroidia bacterium]
MKTYMRRLIFFILLSGLLPGYSFSQCILTVNDSISVTGSAIITIHGGIVLKSTAGGIVNNGKIFLKENTDPGAEAWTNQSSVNSLSGTGTVIFNSTDPQTIDGIFSTKFSRLNFNNSSAAGVSMSVNAIVADTLYLTDGLVNTSSNYLIVTNTAPASVTGYIQGAVTPSYINGNLRRYISSAALTYGFPIGNNSAYYLTEIVSSGISGVTWMDSKFDVLANHNDADLNVTESAMTYSSVCTAGVWYLTPDASPSGALYDIRGYTGNFGCGLIDNEFGILKRPDNSLTAADWTCGTCGIGIGLSPNGGEGRLASQPYALRKALTSFSQFGIGKINSSVVQLPPDTSICLGDSIQINAGSFASYLWSTGATTSSIWVVGTVVGPHTYYVDVINNLGQPSSDTIVITVNPLPIAAISTFNNVSCFGGNNGDATVTASGGTPGYTYTWNTVPAQTTAQATGLTAGSYIVTVTDTNQCFSKASVTLTQPPTTVNAIIIKITDVTCFGGNNGSVIAGANGGVSPYTYAWNTVPPQNSFNAMNLTAGTYTVTVTDFQGCTDTAIAIVAEPPQLIASISAQTDASCNGGNTGTATATATGGTPDYTYAWNTTPVQITAIATGLSAGSFSVVVTDSLLCQDTATVTINEPTSVVASIQSQIDATCNGGNTGSATADATGGTPGYTFSWSTTPVQNAQTATGLAAGTYTVTATDINNCTGTTTVTINEPTAVQASIVSHINASCNGGADGSAVVTASGGTPGYSFLWNTLPAQANDTAITLPVGIYTVTVTDTNNCTDTAMVTIGQPSTITAAITAQTNISCNGGNDGSATVTPGGGLPGFTYLWNTTPVQTTATASSLAAGIYQVTVTDSLLCSAAAIVTITEPAILSVAITDSVNAGCFGDSTGSATVTATGGTPGYTYLWNTIPPQVNATVTGLPTGVYNVMVSDSHNCMDSVSVTISEPPLLTATVTDSSDVLCFGGNSGTAVVSAAGGVQPYSYLWSGGTSITNDTVTGLSANIWYIVTVTDANGCYRTDSVNLAQPLGMNLTPQVINATCGSANGSAWVIVSGGISPYQYNWSNLGVTDTIQNISPGIYFVTVTDSLGCTADTFMNIIDQGGPALNITSANVSCFSGNNGTASVTATGGFPPYTYSWSGGSTPDSASTGGLIAGIYNVTVTDSNNCSSTSTVTVTQPALLSASISSITNVSCYGDGDGTATIIATGGMAPYSYDWSNGDTLVTADSLSGGVYTVTVVDNNNCTTTANTTIIEPPVLQAVISDSTNVLCYGATSGNATVTPIGGTPNYYYQWDNPQSSVTATALGLSANVMYHVTVTDTHGCIAYDSVMLSQPSVLMVTPQTVNSTCGQANGMVSVTVTGGVPAYTYSWSGYPDSLGNALHNISAGTYNVIVMDANGCTNSIGMNITTIPSGTINFTVTDVSCNGMSDGTVSVTIAGGQPPYDYNWSNGDSTNIIIGLPAGTYYLTVTDGNGCISTNAAIVTEPQPLVAQIQTRNVNCKGGVDGRATAIMIGGTPPFSYHWSTGAIDSLIVGASGYYCVTVTDANGCTANGCDSIFEPDSVLTAQLFADSAKCFGSSDGSASAVGHGGIAPYTFIWSTDPIQTGSAATGLKADYYCVTVTDFNHCYLVTCDSLKQPSKIDIDSVITPTSCEEGDDGMILVHTSGGKPPYTFYWYTDPVQTDSLAHGLYHGSYDIKITDSKQCFQLYTLEVPNTPVPCLEIPTAFTPNSDGIHDLWNIKNLHLYPHATIEVYNRWGSLIYQAGTSDKRWDGTYNGRTCPSGSYVFIIDLNNGTEAKQGIITIIR